jgi:hypothetical protein
VYAERGGCVDTDKVKLADESVDIWLLVDEVEVEVEVEVGVGVGVGV